MTVKIIIFKQEILQYLEIKESSRARRPRTRGLFTVVFPEGLDVDVDRDVESNLE